MTKTTNDTTNSPVRRSARGFIYAIISYVVWGVQPIYWKLLAHVSYFELMAHRMFWCFVFVAILARLIGRGDFLRLLIDKKTRWYLLASSVLIAVTWCLFIFVVVSGHIIEAALAVYINPIISLIFSVVFFKERLSVPQKIATGLVTGGVTILVVASGGFVFLSLLLALTFALYGVLKKKCGYPAIPAVAAEAAVFAPLAFAAIVLCVALLPGHEFLSFLPIGDTTSATQAPGWLPDWAPTLLLIGGGAITTIPLVFFASASNKIPLKWMGFLQYIEPFLNLIIGIFLYGEAFTLAHVICFVCVWAGLLLISIELFAKGGDS